jgi:hypothetical protein
MIEPWAKLSSLYQQLDLLLIVLLERPVEAY